MERGWKSDMTDFLPTPRTRNPRRPYSLLKEWTTREFSPNFVVWSTISSVTLTILP